MPCPYFEPQSVVRRSPLRLPLLDEYRGLCHAVAEPAPSPDELRLSCCNHGYSRGVCAFFPLDERRSSIRFDVVNATAEAVEMLYVEEGDHTPIRWQQIRYFPSSGTLEPPVPDKCAAAQLIAFGSSFMRRFSSSVAL